MNEKAIREAMDKGYQFGSYQSESQVEDVIRFKVSECSKLRGQQMGVDILHTVVRKVTEVILRDYPTLTDEEFTLILEAGVSGDLGKETWVSGASILQWLKAYQRDKARTNVIDEQTEEARESKRLTKEEIDLKNKNAVEGKITQAREYFARHGTIFGKEPEAFHLPQFAAVCFDYLRECGDIPEPSVQDMTEAHNYATDQVAQHHTRKEFLPAAIEDYEKSWLLEQFIKNTI